MDWQNALILILGSLLFLMMIGMPVALAFLVVNIIGILIWWGGEPGLRQLILSIRQSVTTFTLLPVPLFILMGEVMFHSGLAVRMIFTLEKWLGHLPGRLSLLAVGAGTLFGTMSGSSMASGALLGSVLVPEMEKQGYKKSMSLGPILGSGGLAVMIPPSGFAVVLGAIAEISIGKTLIAIIVPGILMAVLYVVYIITRCYLQPSIAPAYEVKPTPLSEKLRDTARYILPLGLIIFAVIGFIFLGIATPAEAAASGTLAALILTAAYGKLNWAMLKKSVLATTELSVMILFIIACAEVYSQILAFSGATKGLIALVTRLKVDPIFIIIGMAIVLLILGMFIPVYPIMMITIPVFMPIVQSLGYDLIWFGVIFILCMEMGATSPPFGLVLFVVKGVAPPGTTMGDCYRGALPFLACDLVALILIIAFPMITLWLPLMMR
ncbi:MAG: TRAP transporter large permease subunit [Pseudomonadota bacterium]